MVIGKELDGDIFESIYMAKYRNKDSLIKVGEDEQQNEYFYMGNNLFLRQNKEDKYVFDIMEIPVTKESTGNVAMINVDSQAANITFYAPLCLGYQVVVGEASWDGIEIGWSLVDKVGDSRRVNKGLDLMLDTLEKSSFEYGNGAISYSKQLRRIIENVCVLEESKKKETSIVKAKKNKK